MDQEGYQTREWSSSWGCLFQAIWFAVFMSFALWAPRLGLAAQDDNWTEGIWVLAAIFSMIAAHVLAPAIVMRAFGARPRLSVRFQVHFSLSAWWMAEGHRFTKKQFAAIGSFPVLLGATVGGIYIALTPAAEAGAWLITVYLLATSLFLWYSFLAALQPGGTLFEERGSGTVIHEPLRQEEQESF